VNLDLHAVHRSPLPRKDIGASVVPVGTSHTDTIVCASPLEKDVTLAQCPGAIILDENRLGIGGPFEEVQRIFQTSVRV
jgi:hypothetical protein